MYMGDTCEKHLEGFKPVRASALQGRPVYLDANEEDPDVYQHMDPDSIDVLGPEIQLQLAAISLAGINDVSIDDALNILSYRAFRPACGAGTRDTFLAGLRRAQKEKTDWFTPPPEPEIWLDAVAEVSDVHGFELDFIPLDVPTVVEEALREHESFEKDVAEFISDEDRAKP